MAQQNPTTFAVDRTKPCQLARPSLRKQISPEISFAVPCHNAPPAVPEFHENSAASF